VRADHVDAPNFARGEMVRASATKAASQVDEGSAVAGGSKEATPIKHAVALTVADSAVIAAHPYFECHKRESPATGHRRPTAGSKMAVD